LGNYPDFLPLAMNFYKVFWMFTDMKGTKAGTWEILDKFFL
jgi:hypothetical protein